MMSVVELFAAARTCYAAGRFAEAERYARQLVEREPGHTDGWLILGASCGAVGRLDTALDCFTRAVAREPGRAESHFNLGTVLHAQGQLQPALERFEESLRLKPDYAEAHFNRANVLQECGRLEEAITAYERAASCRPRYTRALFNLAAVQRRAGRLRDAERTLGQLLNADPDFAKGQALLKEVQEERRRLAPATGPGSAVDYLQQGVSLVQKCRWTEALEPLREAHFLCPELPDASRYLGMALLGANRVVEAETPLREAIQRVPNDANALSLLGEVQRRRDHLEEAVSLGRAAVHWGPNDPHKWFFLAVALADTFRFADAEAACRQAARLEPDYSEARYIRGTVALHQGDWERGLREFEWFRCQGGRPRMPHSSAPRWDGCPLEGRTLLLIAEGGSGDILQFLRFAPLAKARGGTVHVQVPRPLVRLAATCPGVDGVASLDEPLPPFDFVLPLLTLPALLDVRLESCPVDIPYLFCEPELRAAWRERLKSAPGFRVGLVWGGEPSLATDLRRSLPLAALAPLATVPHVRLFSVQKGPAAQQIDSVKFAMPLIDLGKDLQDFADTAAVLAELDLLISCDTSVAHLGGALGVATWVALPAACEYRWLCDREDTTWYRTLRLFRQTRPGDWTQVIDRMAAELRRLTTSSERLPSLTAAIVPHRAMRLVPQSPTTSQPITERTDNPEVRLSLARTRLDAGRVAEAGEHLRIGLVLNPNHAGLRLLFAQMCLMMGRWDNGWVDFEFRRRFSTAAPLPPGVPVWAGEPLAGRRILVSCEENLSETLLFLRFIRQVAERGGRVVLRCPTPLMALAQKCPGVNEVIAEGKMPESCAAAFFLSSLPGLFSATPTTVPQEGAYLFADVERRGRWREQLARMPGLRVGLAWSENGRMAIPKDLFDGLRDLPGIQFLDVTEMADQTTSLCETAAILSELDLLLTSGSWIAHLAGALAIPVWVALPAVSEWYWLRDRDDSPWYPLMRLFRQQRSGEWQEVVGRMRDALRASRRRGEHGA